MDKTTQDLAWSVLPKEFKKEVKAHYAGLNAAYKAYLSKDSLSNEECDRCNVLREKMALYQMYFGYRNLTSDVEGEVELLQEKLWSMLTQELKTYCINMGHTSHDGNVEDVLEHLFGNRCFK